MSIDSDSKHALYIYVVGLTLLMLSASAEQIGAAARLRELVHGEDRRKLNYVVHSPHPNPRYGVNPYAENPNYDPDVTDLLKDVAQRHHLPSEDIDLVEVMHDLKDLARRVRCKTEDARDAGKHALAILEKIQSK